MPQAAVAHEDRAVDVPGGTLFARIWRPERVATEEPIVLLHDSLGCVDLWRGFPAALSERTGRPVLAYDRLGFGRSSPRTSRLSRTFLIEEAEIFLPAVREAFGFEAYALFGHSVGGSMAILAAARDPACRAVVSESAQAFLEPKTLVGVRAAETAFADPAKFERLRRWHGEKARWVLDAWTRTWLSPEFAHWSLAGDLRRIAGDLAVPVLAIHGDGDEFGSAAFPETIRGLTRGPSHAELVVGCGHVPHRERPEEILTIVADFLGSVSERAGG